MYSNRKKWSTRLVLGWNIGFAFIFINILQVNDLPKWHDQKRWITGKVNHTFPPSDSTEGMDAVLERSESVSRQSKKSSSESSESLPSDSSTFCVFNKNQNKSAIFSHQNGSSKNCSYKSSWIR